MLIQVKKLSMYKSRGDIIYFERENYIIKREKQRRRTRDIVLEAHIQAAAQGQAHEQLLKD